MVESVRKMTKPKAQWKGLLFIGDPHLENRQPGFRKDDYQNVILEKIKWCLAHAEKNRLLPVFLGDFFEKPRENSNWMIGQLMEILYGTGAIGIYGNHDCANPSLTDQDSLALLIKSECLQLISADKPWRGELNGWPVIVGGSSYREPLPKRFDVEMQPKGTLFPEQPLVFWISHHDINLPGYDGGRLKPREIENVQLLVNGHIHRRLEPVVEGETTWMTPGNISRRSRSDANRLHVPSVLQLDVTEGDFKTHYVTIPHQPFQEVFHEAVQVAEGEGDSSTFISGLKEMLARKTASGAGLKAFLDEKLVEYNEPVAEEIMSLMKEIEDE